MLPVIEMLEGRNQTNQTIAQQYQNEVLVPHVGLPHKNLGSSLM